MPIDKAAAENFAWSAARLVDRHRYALLFADGPAQPVIDALCGYRNPDGGFGHALEPDLRSPGSQPAPTLYALEILNEAGAAGGEIARDARAWIASIAEPDGGIPFVVPGFENYPHAPWWAAAASSSEAKPNPGSFLTLALAGVLHAGGVSDDDWLECATEWSWRSIETTKQPGGYWLKYACAFLDVVPDEQRARAAIAGARGSRGSGRDRTRRRRRGGGVAPAGPLASPRKSIARTHQPVPSRRSPRRRRGRTAGRRRLDVRLAGLVTGADDRLARERHDPRADLAT
jgi:hypothetical protein